MGLRATGEPNRPPGTPTNYDICISIALADRSRPRFGKYSCLRRSSEGQWHKHRNCIVIPTQDSTRVVLHLYIYIIQYNIYLCLLPPCHCGAARLNRTPKGLSKSAGRSREFSCCGDIENTGLAVHVNRRGGSSAILLWLLYVSDPCTQPGLIELIVLIIIIRISLRKRVWTSATKPRK